MSLCKNIRVKHNLADKEDKKDKIETENGQKKAEEQEEQNSIPMQSLKK